MGMTPVRNANKVAKTNQLLFTVYLIIGCYHFGCCCNSMPMDWGKNSCYHRTSKPSLYRWLAMHTFENCFFFVLYLCYFLHSHALQYSFVSFSVQREPSIVITHTQTHTQTHILYTWKFFYIEYSFII